MSIDMEWRAVWSHKVTGATALYLALRYVTLANVITTLISFNIPSCELLHLKLSASGYELRDISCSGRLLLVTRICILISNLLVVVSTWQAARSNRRVGAWNSEGSLIAVLFRGGTIHFALVVVLNAADIANRLLTSANVDISSPVEDISTIVLCRFFLNLRLFSGSPDTNDSAVSSNGSLFSGLSSTIFGNLGDMFENDPQALDDELDHELDERPRAGDLDCTNCPPDNTKTPSTSQMATTSTCRLGTHDKPAADCEPLAAPDVGIDQCTIDIV
ncbi:predicted protein [Postia placenta Mad-698-R]|nr:predicted protein [Postia placenta Mad-698-R]